MAKKRILVVEDVEDSRFILVATLQLYGHHTIEAKTGKEAVEKALAEKPDLIIMDLGLPDISGVEAAKAIKENPSTAHIPIVAHSAWDVSKWDQAARDAGIVAYLQKPVRKELVKDTIEKLLG